METRLGLDTLFKIRGEIRPPKDVLIVALDEKSDRYFNLGWDFKEWRKYHARLIEELTRQHAELIVFDLQFIAEQPNYDPALADAIRSAANVLVTECLRNNNETREQCSKHNQPGQEDHQLPNENQSGSNPWVKILPNRLIREAVLDHAPFVLPDDVANPIIREAWTYINNQTETPALPVLVWFYHLQRTGKLPEYLDADYPLSDWLARQRRICIEKLDESKYAQLAKSGAAFQIGQLFCGEDSHYLNFYGPPKTIEIISYSDVYQGKFSDLNGKIVFVGIAKQSGRLNKQDSFETPFTNTDTGRMAGVEIMATQFANLLEDRYVVPLPPIPIMAAFGFVVAFVLTACPGFYGISISLVLSAIYAFIVQWNFNRAGLWLPFAVPFCIQLPTSWFASLYSTYLDQVRVIKQVTAENNRLIDQFIKNLQNTEASAPNLRIPIFSERLAKASAKEVFGICLATDIKGYTSLAEKNSSDRLFDLLSAYFNTLSAAVSQQGGIIANITGDAMMAVWIDLPLGNIKRSACLATLDITREIELFNRYSSLGPLTTRIGLNQGHFSLGSFVGGGTETANPVGDVVNAASRIEGLNKMLGTRILASAVIVDDIKGISYRRVGTFCFVGKHNPLDLVEIAGLDEKHNSRRKTMFDEFERGLALFRDGRWTDAASIFRNSLERYGCDGPTRFYLDKAMTYTLNPPQNWQGFIILDSK